MIHEYRRELKKFPSLIKKSQRCVLYCSRIQEASGWGYRFPSDLLPAAANPDFAFALLPFSNALFLPPVQNVDPGAQEYPLWAVRLAVVLLEKVFAVECVTLDLVLSMNRDIVCS